MATLTNRQVFIAEVRNAELSEQAREYFTAHYEVKKVNKKETERATAIKTAIVNFLTQNEKSMFDRTQICQTLHNSGELPETYLINIKGELAYNTITAFANQLVDENQIKKTEVKDGKTKRIKYFI